MAKGLLQDLGVDKKRFDTAYDQGFYRRNGLGAGIYFNREDWGVDRIVRYDLGTFGNFLPLAPSPLSPKQAVAQMPISEPARREFLRLLVTDRDRMPGIPADAKEEYLYTLSYRDFLIKHLDIHEPEVFAVLQDLASDSCVGIEAVPAGSALYYAGLPGLGATGLPGFEEEEPYIHHFPDGNASIARLLVRGMIPAVAPGTTMEDVVTARFDYSKLDEAKSPVRLRLNSTAVRVEHDGDPKTAKRVRITYVRGGRAYRVQATYLRARLLQHDDSAPVPRATRVPTRSARAPGQVADPLHDCCTAQLAGVEEAGYRRCGRTHGLPHQRDARFPCKPSEAIDSPRGPMTRSLSTWRDSRIDPTWG